MSERSGKLSDFCDRANECPLSCTDLKDESYCFPVNVTVDCISWWQCKLTTRDFPLIDAMIAGEWDCEKCKHYRGTACCDVWGYPGVACKSWQPKGEGQLVFVSGDEQDCPNCDTKGCADCFQPPPTNWQPREKGGSDE